MKPRSLFVLAAALAVFAAAMPATAAPSKSNTKPDGKGIGTKFHHPLAMPGNGITYHGGPVMLSNKHIYYIWYGWGGGLGSTPDILNNLASNIGGSPYFNINTTYFDANNNHIQNSVAFNPLTDQAYNHYSLGKNLDDDGVFAVVTNALTRKQLPVDPNGVYFVLTSPDVNETTGFCSQYCGWHDSQNYKATRIHFAFIGDGDQCPDGCEAQSISPNNNPGADGMASVIAHELEESATDPNVASGANSFSADGWFNTQGAENGDLCAWTFGNTSTCSDGGCSGGSGANGASYNMTLGAKQYLIQQNWVNANGGFCALRYPNAP